MTRWQQISLGWGLIVGAPLVLVPAITLQVWNIYVFGKIVHVGTGGVGSVAICLVLLVLSAWFGRMLIQCVHLGFLMVFRHQAFESEPLKDAHDDEFGGPGRKRTIDTIREDRAHVE